LWFFDFFLKIQTVRMAPVKRPLKVSAIRHVKRICSSVQSVPFFDWKEHDQVGMALVLRNHHTDLSTEDALERVAVWKTRSTKIAHAIESTAALAQIILRDQQPPQGSVSTTELRHAYASAILRSVNGLADSLQQQRFAASSVALLCAELGVPPWLVAIRHEATHNQLPPLPTLRMAAEAVVQYFSTVYWEPIRQRHAQQYDHAWSLLCQYETAAMDREQSRQQTPSMENQIDADDAAVDETIVENDEVDDDDDVVEVDGLLQSPLGTTSNRFAALLEKKPKSEKATTSENLSAKEPPMKRPKMEPNDTVKHNQIIAACAKQFAMAEIPMDVLHRVAIEFLVARSHETAESMTEESADYGVLMRRFRVLLSTLGRSWPGFLCAFLRECVQQIVDMEYELRNDYSRRSEVTVKGTIFESWIHLLLSRKFLSLVERKSEKLEAKGNVKFNQQKKFADVETLKSLQYPLNRICDELLGPGIVMDPSLVLNPAFARNRLAELIATILGDERVPYYGIDLPIARTLFRAPSSSKSQRARRPNPGSKAHFTMDSALTLEAMEAFLDDTEVTCPIDENGGADESVTKTLEKAPVWLQCQTWEPCAIGSSSWIVK
jgi:Las1-like